MKPAEAPTDFPVVEGSEIVDIHCVVSSLFRRLPVRVFISKVRCWVVKAWDEDANDTARMAAAVENFIFQLVEIVYCCRFLLEQLLLAIGCSKMD